MKARDERVALMNEVLGAIRMLKVRCCVFFPVRRYSDTHYYAVILQFMAWERSFEARVLKVREKELRYQRLNFLLEVCCYSAYKVRRRIDVTLLQNAFNFIWYNICSLLSLSMC